MDDQPIEAWLAETPAQQARGLMGATAEQLAPLPDGTPRGMLFVFDAERLVSFTMRGTSIPLDLAYFTADGTLVETHALTPLDETLVPSSEPVRYALETNAGELAARGLGVGSVLQLPLPAARR